MKLFVCLFVCLSHLDYVMVTNIWFLQVALALTSGVFSTELLPEKYLKPQDFNHHPFTDVGIPASLKKTLKPTNLYAILSKKRPREGREFPPQNVVIYPTPHPSITPRKYLETNEIGKYDDPYANVPKNYAFSYIVKDHYSGDDFSHSQAHNGKATRGQYRVKLPDGRTQIVNYTADHKGYRADVQYEESPVPNPKPNAFTPTHIPLKSSPQIIYALTPSPTAPTPVQYVPENIPLQLLQKPTTAPIHYQPEYVSTTPAPHLHQHFVTPTSAPRYVPQQPLASTPFPSPAHHPPSVVPYHPTYHSVSSTLAPELAVIVTPRPTYNRGIRKNEPQQSAPLYYRLL